MTIRKYKKPHLCNHVEHIYNVFVRVKDSCPNKNKWGNRKDLIYKVTCRECDFFKIKVESEDK